MYDEKKIEDSLKACKEAKTIYGSDFFKNPRNVFDLDTFLPAAQEEELHPTRSVAKDPEFDRKLDEAIAFGMRIRKEKGLPVHDFSDKVDLKKPDFEKNYTEKNGFEQKKSESMDLENPEWKAANFEEVSFDKTDSEGMDLENLDWKTKDFEKNEFVKSEKKIPKTDSQNISQEDKTKRPSFIELRQGELKPQEKKVEKENVSPEIVSETEKESVSERSFFKSFCIRFVELVICVAIAYGLAVLFNQYIGTHTVVDGTSMESTLQDGDVLAVDKISYKFNEPKMYDIIVFPYDENTYYIKRIIGLPGQTIEIRDGEIFIDDALFDEGDFVETMEAPDNYYGPVTLGADEYFVLGDNRNHSVDSRYEQVGLVKRDEIVGRAFLRMYPFKKFGFLN